MLKDGYKVKQPTLPELKDLIILYLRVGEWLEEQKKPPQKTNEVYTPWASNKEYLIWLVGLRKFSCVRQSLNLTLKTE